ncbi:MAG: ATPase domain-containing protein [Candidatus Aenigmatarchaeota archaeon]
MERIKSGVPGLDEIIEGGFIKGHQILLAGNSGTGKTIFGCQFLLEGARRNEKGLYLTLEEAPKSIIENMKRFSWGKNFETYVREKKIIFERILPTSIDEVQEKIIKYFNSDKIRRLVLDSLTVAAMGWKEVEEPKLLRRKIFSLIDVLKQYEITSLLISEIPHGFQGVSKFGFEEFITDMTIRLEFEPAALDFHSKLSILKARGTNFKKGSFQIIISSNGLEVGKNLLEII